MIQKPSADLSQLSTEEIRDELARRAADRLPENATLTDMEVAIEDIKRFEETVYGRAEHDEIRISNALR